MSVKTIFQPANTVTYVFIYHNLLALDLAFTIVMQRSTDRIALGVRFKRLCVIFTSMPNDSHYVTQNKYNIYIGLGFTSSQVQNPD